MKIMRKIIITLILVLLFAPTAMAKTGGPIECVGKKKLAISFATEYIQEQRMRQDSIYINTGGTVSNEKTDVYHFTEARIDRYFLKLNYGLLDNIDIFLKLGAQREKILSHNNSLISSDKSTIFLIGDYNPLVAGGFNTNLFSIRQWCKVGFSVEYLWSKGKAKRYNIDSPNVVGIDILDSDTEYYSWNASLYFYKRFKLITPYVGASYQNSMYSFKGDMLLWLSAGSSLISNYDSFKFNQDMPLILFGGIDFHINKRLDANIELSTFGSRSASFGLTWRF